MTEVNDEKTANPEANEEPRNPHGEVEVGMTPGGAIGVNVRDAQTGETAGAQIPIDVAWRLAGQLQSLATMIMQMAWASQIQAAQEEAELRQKILNPNAARMDIPKTRRR